MRLLPRSRRGTWLLAGAVWCAACAGLWWALPVVPLAEWAIDDRCAPIGFLRGHRALLTSTADGQGNSGARQGPIRLWDVDNGDAILGKSTDRYSAATISPDGQRLAISPIGSESAIRIIALSSRKDVEQIPRAEPNSVIDSVGYSPNGEFIAYVERGTAQSRLRIWDSTNRSAKVALKHSPDNPIENYIHGPHIMAWSPDGRMIAVSATGNSSTTILPRVQLWNAELGELVGTLVGPSGDTIAEIQFSPDSRMIATTFKSRGLIATQFRYVLKTWDVTTGSEVSTILDDAIGLIGGVSWNTDLWTSSPANRICVLEFGKTIPTWEYHMQNTESPIGPPLADDGKTLSLFCGQNNAIMDWFVRQGWIRPWHEIRIIDGSRHTDIAHLPLHGEPAIGWTAFSPDSRLYAISEGGTLRLWDLPPSKSATWFAAGATLLALPIAILAWRRTRKLKAA